MKNKVIVSESVTGGHPDKIADRISDSILNEFYVQDRNTRAGIEVMVKDNIVVLGGEVSSSGVVDYDQVVRDVYRSIDFPEWHGLSPDKIKIINLIGKQSMEISAGVDREDGVIGAGDQGFVCGFATNETPTYMGLGHYIAKRICRFIENMECLGPDGKAQVIVKYDGNGDAVLDSILVSTMHIGMLDNVQDVRNSLEWWIRENDIGMDKGIYDRYIKDKNVSININPCGAWHTGGPVSDCGVTGRKIVVDQFGGYCSVGGGNLTGKDMSKVDRSGAYMARYLAKNIVAAGVADSAKVELSYMIGMPEPSSVYVSLEGCTHEEEEAVRKIIVENIDLTPGGIIKRFGFIPYAIISEYGHYGVDVVSYSWEKTDIADLFKWN